MFHRKNKTKKILGTHRFDFYDVHPYDQLKDDLTYAKNDIIYQTSGILVKGRKYRDCLLMFILVKDFDEYLTTGISLEYIQKNMKKDSLEYGFEEAYLNLNKKVIITLFEESSERTIKYCIKNTKTSKKEYLQYLVFNKEECSLDAYRPLIDFSVPLAEYNTAMYFDLGAIDKEEV